MEKVTLKGLWQVLKDAFSELGAKKVPALSAALAYFSIFSLGPMLIVILFLSELLWSQQALEGTIYNEVSKLIGPNAAMQIQEIIKNSAVENKSGWNATISIITLIIGATTVFSQIQASINFIWDLKVKAGKGVIKLLLTRLLSFSIVVGLGFLMLISLIINGLLEALMDELRRMFPDVTVVLFFILNLLLNLLIIGFLFAIIFKVLPDAVIRWKDVTVGAVFTTVLFMLTRFGMGYYIGQSDLGSTYGAAGSIVVLLLWIYATALILYFGACFTKAYAVKYGTEIRPNEYTVTVQTRQEESAKATVQENEEEKKQKNKDQG